jgi:hypothetical protein
MVLRSLIGFVAGLLGVSTIVGVAHADGMLFPGTRPLGAGGAMRAAATGDAGPMLNPSGISLMRSYAIEGAYQYGKELGSQDARISAVDSTSGFNVGGALYYNYHYDGPGEGIKESGHLGGASLSVPVLERAYLGANFKYVHFEDGANRTHSGFTFDAGLTLRLIPQISLGGVAYNLRDLDTWWAPRGYGGGVAVLPLPALMLVFDVVSTKVYGDQERDQALSFMGGAEFSMGTTAGIRAGGGRDGNTRNGYVTAGITVISAEIGALDFGIRQDVSGQGKTTMVGASARLFVPTM